MLNAKARQCNARWRNARTQEVLTAHGFDAEGRPLAATEVTALPLADACLPQDVVENALAAYNATRPEALQIPVDAAKEGYEEPTRVVNVSIDGYGYRRVGHLSSGMEAPVWCGAGTNGFGLGYTPSPCFGKPRLLKQATTRCGRPSVDAQEPLVRHMSIGVRRLIF